MATTVRVVSVKTIDWAARMEVAKLLTIGSDGRLAVYDEVEQTVFARPQNEVDGLWIQLKTATARASGDGTPTIDVPVSVTHDGNPDQRLYYLIAYFSPRDMRFLG